MVVNANKQCCLYTTYTKRKPETVYLEYFYSRIFIYNNRYDIFRRNYLRMSKIRILRTELLHSMPGY